ncbi:hypothetical protein [Georgenia ruanii]|uniref:hypothetical protein n=1 Tax=Georgenia ruanii TaxID=348442 RepID=UPI00126493F3|nr:hypothetical protein [Georgenia ruanii]
MRNAPAREPPPASVVSLTVFHGAGLADQTPLLRPWGASLYLESHGAPTLLLGSSMGFLADLRSGGNAVADQLDVLTRDSVASTALLRRINRALSRPTSAAHVTSLMSDTAAMSALLRRTGGTLSPHTSAQAALLIQHVTLEPWCRGHGLGAPFAGTLIDGFSLGRDHLPVLLVPRPDGWAEMLAAERRVAQTAIERSWARMGFTRHRASAEVWWLESASLPPTTWPPVDHLTRPPHGYQPGPPRDIRRPDASNHQRRTPLE